MSYSNQAEKSLDLLKEISSILDEDTGTQQALHRVFRVLEKEFITQGTVIFSRSFADFQIQGTSVLETDPQKGSLFHELAKKALTQNKFIFQSYELLESANLASLTTYSVAIPLRTHKKNLGALCFILSDDGENGCESLKPFLSCLATMLAQKLLLHRQFRAQDTKYHTGEPRQPKIKTRIKGNSKAIRTLFELISRVSNSDTSVLILGESGAGKELVASAIHDNSARRNNQMIKVNCSTLPESLLESELFGHEKGSFTGATALKKGRFENAHKGTLFLDEIGEISLPTQVKLLRFLQEKEFERVGGVQTISSDVRIIAATNRNLEKMIDTGEFRLDLYYRLNVFPIRVPSLRERKPDIIPIADFFVERYNKIFGKTIKRISTPAIDLLVSYHWPGNVRELENCIERAILLSTDNVLHSHHLPPSLQAAEACSRHQESFYTTLETVECELIKEALRDSKGNMAKASRTLGLTERVMALRTKKYKLVPKEFR